MSVETPVSEENQPDVSSLQNDFFSIENATVEDRSINDMFATLHPDRIDAARRDSIHRRAMSARHRPLPCLYRNRLSNDEFRILNAIRCVAENNARRGPSIR